MGSVAVSEEEEREFDADETIFVAVGKRAEQSERALLWAVRNFSGKTICVLHVHRPSRLLAMRFATEGNTPAEKLKQFTIKSYQELEQEKLRELLLRYRNFLTDRGVRAYEAWVEMDDIEKGIVEMIVRHNVKWLVMGAVADDYYNERLADLKSKKAIFVCQEAASSCHIWFVCKGHLIYTRGGKQESSDIELLPPILLINSPAETCQIEPLMSESTYRLSSSDTEGGDELEDIPSWLFSEASVILNLSSKRVVDTPTYIPSLAGEDQQVQEQKLAETHLSVEQSIEDNIESKGKDFVEAAKRWKDEEDIVEAKCKAKAFQSLYVKEISHGKEIEETVQRVKLELESMKDEHNELMKKLRTVREENLALESQVAKSEDEIGEWEEKTLSAVRLLITFKERRDKSRIEHEKAIREVAWLKKMMKGEGASKFSRSKFPVFTFLEINEATNEFDPSWKIAEGRNGTVYRGNLCQMHVAIKMLPSYGLKNQLDFQREVGIISRVRHPNLVTLIGMCPESHSIVYEYLKKGSLEDCLSRKDNTIPWQVRTRIATEICFSLIFIHSNEPCIVHGNVKPSNIFLDANYVSKLGNLGLISLTPQNNPVDSTENNPNRSSGYADPYYLETGELRPESDVYSFGLVLLRLLTARPLEGLVKEAKCALENGNISTVLDSSAGDWPLDRAKRLVQLALRCCSLNRQDRPNLALDILAALETMKASCTSSASNLVSKKLKRTPAHFVCPILQEIMEDPQIAADGFTYESEAIRGWLDTGHSTSPMTNLKLDHLKLVPNYALQNAIIEWQLQQ